MIIKLFMAKLDNLQAYTPRLYRDVLNTDEQQMANRLKIQPVRNQRILSRAILRLLLAQETNQSAKNIQLHSSKHGKPFLKNKHLYFNISHTHQMLVIALSNQYEIGIDIEYNNSNLKAENMPEQCFHKQEWQYFQSLSYSTKQSFFLDMWTKKEAISKALGLGFQLPFNSINILNAKSPILINNNQVQQYKVSTTETSYTAALATVSSQVCQLSPWQELQSEWMIQCLM